MSLRGRHRAEFEQFATAHADSLKRLAYVLCGDRSQAQDASQEALWRVFQRWGRIENPAAYARSCVVNATRDDWRRSARRRRAEQAAAELPTAPATSVDDEVVDRDRMLEALGRLSHRQRAVVVLRYWHQLSEAETAGTLGVSVGTIKTQASRGLNRLRELLEADLVTNDLKEHS